MAKMNQAMTDLLRYNAAILPRKRSMFDKSHSHLTTMDSAYLVPIMWDRVLPGDEKKIRYSGLARMATPIHPVMDEAYLDTWCFFVPDRLWWCHAKEFYGENKDASFNPDGEYVMPYLKPKQYYMQVSTKDGAVNNLETGYGSLNDYFGMPHGYVSGNSKWAGMNSNPDTYVTAGLHRSYQLIWNEYYRNSSVQPALQLNDGDTVTDAEWKVISKIRKVCKLPDMFTTLLREPQAGEDVLLPLGEWAPVVTRNKVVGPDDYRKINGTAIPMHFAPGVDVDDSQKWADIALPHDLVVGPSSASVGQGGSLAYDNGLSDAGSVSSLIPVNLWANLTNATSATINNLRAAITVQQLLEIDAIGGKRYQQILQAHFGVFTPDATLQRPELLGATRTRIGMRQVLQTSSTDATSPQGNTAAVSVTNVANEWICNKAFTEPGFIMVLCAVRPLHSYSQGVNPLLRKLQRYDHYWPVFDNLGNQPVYVSEIMASSYGADGKGVNPEPNFTTVFGYKEAWQEYRMMANRVSGKMRPVYNGVDLVEGNLSSWNYSDYFDSTPLLNSAFVEENPDLIDRTIAVTSEPQFLLDSYFEYTDIKNMSVHSVPGLTRL